MKRYDGRKLVLLATVVSLFGCGAPSALSTKTVIHGDGELIQRPEDLDPSASPGAEAQLVYGGTDVPVSLEVLKNGQNVEIRSIAHDELLDTERYQASEDAFKLVDAAGETCDPPIDLLRFPMRIGDGWQWSGQMTAGGLAKKAHAQIVTSKDRLFEESVPLDAVKVHVALTIEANGSAGPPAKRALDFWFGSSKGIIRREFGAASVREPRN